MIFLIGIYFRINDRILLTICTIHRYLHEYTHAHIKALKSSDFHITEIIYSHVYLLSAIYKQCTLSHVWASNVIFRKMTNNFNWIIYILHICRWWTRKSRRRRHCSLSSAQNSTLKTSLRNWYKTLHSDFFIFRYTLLYYIFLFKLCIN